MSATSWLAADPPPAEPPAPGEAQPGAVWRLPSLVLFAVVGLAYAAGAEAAVRALAISGLQAVFFIPAGVVAAALLRCPMRQWWVVLSAAAAAEAARDLTTGKWALAAVAGYVLANVTGPAVGAALTRRWCAAPLDLARRRHVAALAVGAVLIGPAVAAAIGAGADRLFQGDAWWTTWWQWWLGDASGVALVGIALLAWGSSPDRRRLSLRSGAALLAVSAAASVASFAAWDLPLAFLVLVVVVLAGAVFGARAVALSTLAMASTAAVSLLLNPRGVIVGVADDTALVLIKAELMVFAFAGLWVAAEGFDRERHARTVERLRRRVEDERREAATLARLNEALRDYRLLFDQAVDGVFVADAAGRFLDLNGAACAMLGYTPAELAGRPLAEVFAAEEAGRIEAEVGRLREDHVAHHRWLLRRRDGTLFIGELAGRRLPDGRIQGVLRDVTEQVRLAHALEESHERLRTLFDTSLDGILVTDEAGLVVSLNRAAGALFGYAEEELVGRHVSVLAPEPQRALRRAHLARFAASGEGGLVGRRLGLDARRRDGSVFPVEVSVGELTLSDGRRFFTAAVHDIAARKAAEAQAAESYRLAEAQRSLLETVIGAAPVGMAVFDEEFRCLHLNQAMAAINGAPLDESLGRTVAEYLPRQWPQLEGVLTRALTEPLIGVEIEVADPTQPDGMQWRLANLYPVPLGGGRRGVAVVVTDITERKRSERSLAESEAQLRSLFSSIDEGFCVCEMVVDADGRPVDYRFLELNPLFEEMTGLVDAAGRTALELVPDLEPSWIETYARVALGGETLRFEEGSAAMGRWFDVFAAPLGVRGRFAIVFKDQTQRRLAELAQRSAAARDAYRARLVDALRVVADPVEVQAEAAKALGEHLQATRVHYAEIDESGEHATVYADYHPDGAGMVGRRLLADYGRAVQRSLRAGETVVVRDVSGDPRLSAADRAAAGAVGVGAYVMVPLVKRGRIVAALVVQLAAPHDWTADELAVVGETAERTWAAVEQARAEKALRLRHARSELAARLLAELEAEPSFEAKLARVASALTPALADLALVEAPEREAPVLGAAHLDPAEAAALRRPRRRP
ncbi:MAG: PAS domain S-box protein, partial [Acidimicrobiales bacterium]